MFRIPFVSAILLGVITAIVPGVRAAETVSVLLKGSDTGRTFQGVGAVSAGASTRLLYDYAEPYRSDVLDFLFRPGFGAAFQHLKVEIGGGENSTCGSEPSHAVTRDELAHPKARGYEFWLMREARNRNPRVMLDCLPWCYPGWIRGRFSQDATDWFVAFLETARKQYGMEVDWVSAAQNENGTDRDWIVKSVRPTLDRKGFGSVKIQAPDCDKQYWAVFDEFEKDPAYRDAVDAVGYHYVNGREPWNVDQVSRRDTTAKAKASDKQLWASEEWSMSGGKWDGTGAMFLARLINKLYVRDRICKTEIWCPIASIYAGLPWSDTGAMQADSPWSGHYAVWPAVWAVAHTTQFAQPGWKYLDGGCGQIDPKTWKGTYVSLRGPRTGDWSLIVCTDGPTTLRISVSDGLKTGPVHVWQSDAQDQFVKLDDIPSAQGVLAVRLHGNSVYTLTTTTGQRKGAPAHAIPAAKPFPFPCRDDFKSYKPGETPRYFSDQKGTFEVCDEPGHGRCLKQIVPQQGIMWEYHAHRRQAVHGLRRPAMEGLFAFRRRADCGRRRRTRRAVRRPEPAFVPLDPGERRLLEAQVPGAYPRLGHDPRLRGVRVAFHETRAARNGDPRDDRRSSDCRGQGFLAVERHAVPGQHLRRQPVRQPDGRAIGPRFAPVPRPPLRARSGSVVRRFG